MNFDSFNDFLMMGGHGLYVWLSYGVGLLVLMIAAISPVIERKRVVKQVAQQIKRQASASHEASHHVSELHRQREDPKEAVK